MCITENNLFHTTSCMYLTMRVLLSFYTLTHLRHLLALVLTSLLSPLPHHIWSVSSAQSSHHHLNMSSDSVRRIMAELKELQKLNTQPNRLFHALPLESDLFEWHFTVRGPPDTAFESGIYHGRILLPAEYPLKAPEIILLTPNGRFETGKRICLSVTAHHQETWQPSWGIRTIITALIGFMPSKAEGVGALDYPDDHRRLLARRSHKFRCERCGVCPAEQLAPRGRVLGAGSSRESAHVEERAVEETREVQTEVQTEVVGSEMHQTPRSDVRERVVSPRQRGTQERELLYLAYAIAVVMVGIVIRRVVKLFD